MLAFNIKILTFLFGTMLYLFILYSLIVALYHAWKHKIALVAGSRKYFLYRQPKKFWFTVIIQVLIIFMLVYVWIDGLLNVLITS